MLCKKILQHFNGKYSLQKLLATSQNVYFTNDAQRKEYENISVAHAVNDYLKQDGLEDFVNDIPKKFLRKQCVSSTKLCLVDHNTAKKICSIISQDLLQNTSFVVDCNPSLGFLPQELLNIGVPSIHLYEKHECFIKPESPLGQLIAKHNLDLRQLNFFDIWLTLLRDKHLADDFGEVYLKDMPVHKWESEPFAQIIAMCPNRIFFSLLIHNFFNQTKLFDHGRVTFFLVLPSDVWQRIKPDNTADKSLIRYYNQYSVFLHLFFNFECLGQVSRRAFIPWPRVKESKVKINPIELPMQVIKLEPKRDLFDLISVQELKPFWFFLKYGMRTKKNKVLPEIEKWVPGCGPRLILLDIDICTRFKELSPQHLLKIFKNFRTWPEYDENFFVPVEGYADSEEIKNKDDEKIELDDIEQENIINKDETAEENFEKHSMSI